MSKGIYVILLIKVALISHVRSEEFERDPQGYLVYCGCMGTI
jgi:hypothetical protein